MKKIFILSVFVFLLGGCASVPPKLTQPVGVKTPVNSKIIVSELLK